MVRLLEAVRGRYRRARRRRRKPDKAGRSRATQVEVRRLRAAAARARGAGDDEGLLAALSRIVELRPRRAVDHYRLGRAYEKLGRDAEAAAAYGEGLAHDPRARPVDHALLAARPERFMSRRRLAHFVEKHLDEIRAAYAATGPPTPSRPETVHVFVYWAQGFDQAPPVVRMCRDQLVALHAPGVVVCLDDQTVADWVQLPEEVLRAGAGRLTQLSDLVRVALLAEHGGIWVDATVLVTTELTALYDELTPSGFFAPTYRPGGIASWMMASERHGYAVSLMRETEIVYWKAHRRPEAYFKFHQMFEAHYLLDPTFAASYDGMPTVRPHLRRLHGIMRDRYAPKRLRRMLGKSFAHKLTYKLKGAEVDPATETGTNLAYILEHGVPEHERFVWADRPEETRVPRRGTGPRRRARRRSAAAGRDGSRR